MDDDDNDNDDDDNNNDDDDDSNNTLIHFKDMCFRKLSIVQKLVLTPPHSKKNL